ncbi:DNA repair protein rad52 [Mortierella polycephala]|uniref:DNA repair protein rad52 n=1 Tax=Mortierella polycephala TaxID=41804 RepID=A0A9P6QCP8_9FUNG|nr:DNA repair protein rad52 [Mortierella polycephala]
MIPKTEPGTSRSTPNSSMARHMSGSAHIPNENPSMFRAHNHPSSSAQHSKLVEFTEDERARLNKDLSKYLAPEFTATRAGPGRSTLTYIEGWRIKNLANKLFGFNGWNSAITDVTVDFLDVDGDGRVSLGVSVMIKVTLKDGTYHEDIGYGASENQRSKAASFEKAKKEATTDGLKRALTSFGNVLGTCLYDKSFCKYLSTQHAEKPRFDEKEFYYYPTDARPQQSFQPQQPQRPQQQTHTNFNTGVSTAASSAGPLIPSKPDMPNSNSVIARQPQTGAQAGSSTTIPGTNLFSFKAATTSTNSIHPQSDQNNSQAKMKAEDDDDLFFGADIDDNKAFIAESSRLSDFDLDIMDMMADDSPVRVKSAGQNFLTNNTSNANRTPPAKLNRTFSRSTSSPSLVQTTLTRLSPTAQRFQGQQPVPFKIAISVGSSAGNSNGTSLPITTANNPFAPKQTSSSSSSTPTLTMTPTSQGSNATPTGSSAGSSLSSHATNPFAPSKTMALSSSSSTAAKGPSPPPNHALNQLSQNSKHWSNKEPGSNLALRPSVNQTSIHSHSNLLRANSIAAKAQGANNTGNQHASNAPFPVNQMNSVQGNNRISPPSSAHSTNLGHAGQKRPHGLTKY